MIHKVSEEDYKRKEGIPLGIPLSNTAISLNILQEGYDQLRSLHPGCSLGEIVVSGTRQCLVIKKTEEGGLKMIDYSKGFSTKDLSLKIGENYYFVSRMDKTVKVVFCKLTFIITIP